MRRSSNPITLPQTVPPWIKRRSSLPFILPQTVQFGYHKVCGRAMKLTENGVGAERKDHAGYYDGVVYSSLPLRGTAEFEVIITGSNDQYGALLMGVARYKTGQSIQACQVPSFSLKATNHCVWWRNHVYNNMNPLQKSYGIRDPFDLKKGDRVGLRLSHDGELVFFVNGESQGVAAEEVYEEGYDVYVVVDHYSTHYATAITRAGSGVPSKELITMSSEGVKALASDASGSPSRSGSPPDDTHGRNPAPIHEQNSSSNTSILPQTIQFGYHNVCGRNMKLTENGLGAKRKDHAGCYNGVAYSSLPLKGTADFEVIITGYTGQSGGLLMGVARYKTSQNIQVYQIPSFSLKATNHCVWCGDHITNNINHHQKFTYGMRDLFNLRKGDRVGLRLSHDGKLVFFVNGVSQGVAAEKVYEEGYDVYAIVDHYRAHYATAITRAVREQELNKLLSGVTSEASSEGVKPLASAGSGSPSRSWSLPGDIHGRNPALDETAQLPQTVQFGYHNVCGRAIKLTENGMGAKRKDRSSCYNGVVYSSLPLKGTAEFEVTITGYTGQNGGLLMGVARYKTSQGIQVNQIPSLSSKATNHCVWWGNQIFDNMNAPQKFTYGIRDLFDVRKGDRVGLRLSHDGKLVFFLNGEGQGVAAENIYEEGYDVYAVVDHYTCCYATAITRAALDTPLHSAALLGDMDKFRDLLKNSKYDVNCIDSSRQTPLHYVCASGCASGQLGVVRILLSEFKANISCIDSTGQTPLHCACFYGHLEVVSILISQFNAPILLRNDAGKTPREVAHDRGIIDLLDKYMRENKDKIYAFYDDIQKKARKRYSTANRITRIFVIGNPGAGKSSLVETLKVEAFLDSFKRVSESSVPPHTAGIVPCIHTSKYYGRVLFYDFAGDPEYYSSHAAILENLASSKKGNNIFIIVVDLREENVKINGIINYWLSFIQYQKFGGEKPSLILIGSHTDLMTKEETMKKEMNLKRNCAFFLLDCCKPKSRQIGEVQKHIFSLIRESPCYKLSPEASMLLGLLEKDFSDVTACSIQTLLSHIKTTGIHLPTEVKSLHPILHELHEIGLLFMISNSNLDNLQIVLNMSQLTNKVHQILFSKEAARTLRQNCEDEKSLSSFNIGVIPVSILETVLPEYITKECLVHLQYCQEISHKDVGTVSFVTQSNSTDQSFLFFPALCSIDKSKGGVSWVTPPDLSYHIGWLAQCTDPCDYFPPRFLHVLLLRLIFTFTVSISTQNHDHSCSKRSCTVWKTGVHWLMEQGVECLVELVNANKEVVVLTKIIPCDTEKSTLTESNQTRAEFCAFIFTNIISCVMEAKAEFCHSIRPEFFLLDSTNEAYYLDPDNMFSMCSVERILACPEGKEVIISDSGRRHMEFSKLLCMHKLTQWYNLFPIDSISVLRYLDSVVAELHDFGLDLGFSDGVLEALKVNFPRDVEKRRETLVSKWMNSSLDLDRYPPCWWHLMEALESINKSTYAEKIKEDHSVHVQLQEKLLVKRKHNLKPDKEFLKSFAGVVGSKWPSLAVSLSLSESEIEEVKGKSLSQQEYTLQMLMKWVKRKDATYGLLCQRLRTISLFQNGNE